MVHLSIALNAPCFGPQEQAGITDVLASGSLFQGRRVEQFEREYSARVGGRRCVAVSSGSIALVIALRVAGIGPGDTVLLPSFSFVAPAFAVLQVGATPRFVDIEPEHCCVDPDALAAAVDPSTVAVIAVDLYGHPADSSAIRALCDRYGLVYIEDAAQAHDATLAGRPVGTSADLTIFSFHQNKNMTTGEGGLLVCADPALAVEARALRHQGSRSSPAIHNVVGYNGRMTEIQAAIGRAQLRRLSEWTATRRRHAAALTTALGEEAGKRSIIAPHPAPGTEPAWNRYTVAVPDRDRVLEAMRARGIECKAYYPVPAHHQPALSGTRGSVDLPVTDHAARRVLSLPVHPQLGGRDIDEIAAALLASAPP